MHDPKILAFEIKYPWWQYKPWPKRYRYKRDRRFAWEHDMHPAERAQRNVAFPAGYRETFISIWHKDPQHDGSDDSCGFTFPKLTGRQKEALWNGTWSESVNPHFLAHNGRTWEGSHADAVSLYAGLVHMTARLLEIKLSNNAIQLQAIEKIHWPDCCPTTSLFCFQPGYHTNNPKDDPSARRKHFYGILCMIARELVRNKRPWYRHPRWHFHHWRFQIHPLQCLKRWLFSRCALCRCRFTWRDCHGNVVSHQWENAGPRWFRGEPNLFHSKCSEIQVRQMPLPTDQRRPAP